MTTASSGSFDGAGRVDSYDGLRAIAVLLVVAFHTRLGFAPGGYLGVDVFFVLSGFLITGLLVREIESSARVDLVGFWFRRVRRLVPAGLLAIIGTSAMFAFVAPVPARHAVIPDARSAALWYSNWHFIVEARDYFRPGLVGSPFLHFWSLSVEEQFYFVWPVVCLAIASVALLRRIGRSPWTIAVVATIAAVYAWTVASSEPIRAYYGTDTRAYQLLAGAALAVWFARASPATRRPRLLARGPLVVVETIVVVAAMAWLTADGGLARRDAAIGITLVTLWLLLRLAPGSPFVAHRSPIGAVLSTGTLVRIGRISYGVYLWHWPVIVVLDQTFAMEPPTRFVATLAIALGLASASWIFVEQPAQHLSRRVRSPGLRAGVVVGAVVSSLVVAFVVVPVALSDRLPLLPAVERPGFTPNPGGVTVPSPAESDTPGSDEPTATDRDPNDASATDSTGSTGSTGSATGSTTGSATTTPPTTAPRSTPVPDDLGRVPYDEELADASRCVITVPTAADDCVVVDNGPPRTLIIGDSHAARIAPAIIADARTNGGTVATVLGFGCPWQSTLLPVDGENCADLHRAVLETVIPQFQPDTIVVDEHPMLDPGWHTVPADGSASADDWSAQLLTDTTTQALRAISAPEREIALVLPLPTAPFNVTDCLSAVDTVEQCAFQAAGTIDTEVAALTAAADQVPGTRVVSVTGLVCPRYPICDAIIDGTLVREDTEHLYHGFVEQIGADLVKRILGT